MIIYLRHATDSQTRKLPPFVDSGDGNSEETGLTIANTDILIGKPGGTTLTAKHSGGATHISNGIYYATFDSSDSDTVGNGELYIHKAGALYVFATLVILPAKVYDSLFLGSDNLEVDIVQLLGTAWLTPAVAGTPDVNAKTVADKTGFSLSVTPPTAESIRIEMDDHSKLANLPSDPADQSTIAAAITAAHATTDALINSITGAGLTAKTYTLTDAITGLPLAGVQVWATTDLAGLNQVDITRTTNDAGQVIFQFNLAAGTTVYIWNRYLATGAAPDTEVV